MNTTSIIMISRERFNFHYRFFEAYFNAILSQHMDIQDPSKSDINEDQKNYLVQYFMIKLLESYYNNPNGQPDIVLWINEMIIGHLFGIDPELVQDTVPTFYGMLDIGDVTVNYLMDIQPFYIDYLNATFPRGQTTVTMEPIGLETSGHLNNIIVGVTAGGQKTSVVL